MLAYVGEPAVAEQGINSQAASRHDERSMEHSRGQSGQHGHEQDAAAIDH